MSKCLIDGCTNTTENMRFIGKLCAPCDEYIKTGVPNNSQLCKNQDERKKYLMFIQQLESIVKTFLESVK